MLHVRPPAVAGLFYPGVPDVLRHDVRVMLNEAVHHEMIPKAIVAPHAGYVYSGPIAAAAYALLQPIADHIRRVVLLGPAHRVWIDGLALPDADAFDTPLGRIEIDAAAAASLLELPYVERNATTHAMEHSLEVQLPFLQSVLPAFKLVPLVVGGASPDQVAHVLDILWGGDETLIVVSSDLSHYLPYATAQQIDRATVDAILNMDSHLAGEQACGAGPINGLIRAAARRGLSPHLLDLRNSGDTAGDRQRVVGYAALAFTEDRPDARQ